MTNLKNPSPLVETVLKLDSYLSEIVRLGEKIESMELKTDFDYEQAQKLMNRFTQCGQGVTEEVLSLSANLNEARAKAEAAAQLVAQRALQLQARQEEHAQKMEDFRSLGDKVRDLTTSLQDLQQHKHDELTEEDKVHLSSRLGQFRLQLQPLIEEALRLKQAAHVSRLKTLEQGSDSLVQSLSAIERRLQTFQESSLLAH